MMYHAFTLIIFVTFTFTSCNSENPSISETGYGKVLVKSNIQKSEIHIEGEFTGYYTPDTLELLAVNHNVKVRKDGYFSDERRISVEKSQFKIEEFTLLENDLKKNVLIESFRGPEISPPHELDSLSNLHESRIFIVHYPPISNPNENPLSYTNFTDQMEREDYLGQVLKPFIAIDGKISTDYEQDVAKQLIQETKFEIILNDSLAQGNILKINVFIDVYDIDGIAFNNLVLRILIIENGISVDSFLNPTEKIIVSNVFRTFVPDHNGISLAGVNQKGRVKFAELKILDPRWSQENLEVIAYIQSSNDRKIIQVAKSVKLL